MFRRAAILVVAAALPAGAQMRLDAREPANRGVVRAFEELWKKRDDKGRSALGCEIRQVGPGLGFDLRLWSGYAFSIPVADFKGQRQARLSAVIKVEPLEPVGEPVYLGRRLTIPNIPEEPSKKLYLSAGGGFSVGAGRFRANLLIADGRGRACMKSWTIKAKKPRGGGVRLAPGEVADASDGWKGFAAPAAGVAARRVTVVMNAHPVTRRRHLSSLSWRDQSTLMNVLASLLAGGGYHSARVIAFDLFNRRVVYDERQFGPGSFDELADALATVNPGTVDFETLAQGPTEHEFVESIVKQISKQESRGEIVFVTPPTEPPRRTGARNEGIWEGMGRPSVLALLPRPVAEGSVIDVAKGAKGRIFAIYSPSDLATAVERMAAARP